MNVDSVYVYVCVCVWVDVCGHGCGKTNKHWVEWWIEHHTNGLEKVYQTIDEKPLELCNTNLMVIHQEMKEDMEKSNNNKEEVGKHICILSTSIHP